MSQALIVFSHLRWNFVHQRPQHLLTGLSRHYQVYFIEEPVYTDDEPYLERCQVAPNIVVCRPHGRTEVAGFHDDHIAFLQEKLRDLLADTGTRDYSIWFYTPMALPLIDALAPRVVIYDCMDELASFLNAPRQLAQRERALLKRADLVFTGGISLYRAKRDKHPAVHCFPSSVDAQHFAQTSGESHVDQMLIPRPRLGFFGVIDERIDFSLLERIADARPSWHLVLVGPVAKIAHDSLPRRPNIHYLGQREYRELPAFVAGWDVCLMPFALNEATRFISPTKTLEYLAAGKPVVSTPIADVVESYADVVQIAKDAQDFISACEAVFAELPNEREKRLRAAALRVEQTSWDATVEKMHLLIQDAWTSQPSSQTAVEPKIGRTNPSGITLSLSHLPSEFDTVVIGAGPTGLSAAYHLGKGSLLLEAQDTVGGWCRSIEDHGFTFDCAGHIMFSNDAYVHEMYQRLLGDNVHWQDREAWIYSKGVYTRYPFQGALYGLPPDVLKECIVGAIEARFGPISESTPAAASLSGGGKEVTLTDCCADGSVDDRVSQPASLRRRVARGEPKNFEEFIYRVWGAGVAKHFALPYNRKLWAVPLSEMETSWLGGRVPLPNLDEMIDGALRPVPKPVGPNARFGYPLRGGFQALMNGFLPLLEGALRLNARVKQVIPSRRELVLEDGTRYRYKQLISTAPLPTLVRMIEDEAPVAVREAAERLRHVSVRCVNLGIARPNITDKHWIYYPEDTVFHRIFVQGNASPMCNPPGGFGLTCEITYSASKPLPCEGDALIALCIADAIRCGLLRADDEVIVGNEIDMPYAYVVYDHERKKNFEIIRDWLSPYDILLAGRYSEWQYYNSDHAFLAGRTAAETALNHLSPLRLDAV